MESTWKFHLNLLNVEKSSEEKLAMYIYMYLILLNMTSILMFRGHTVHVLNICTPTKYSVYNNDDLTRLPSHGRIVFCSHDPSVSRRFISTIQFEREWWINGFRKEGECINYLIHATLVHKPHCDPLHSIFFSFLCFNLV